MANRYRSVNQSNKTPPCVRQYLHNITDSESDNEPLSAKKARLQEENETPPSRMMFGKPPGDLRTPAKRTLREDLERIEANQENADSDFVLSDDDSDNGLACDWGRRQGRSGVRVPNSTPREGAGSHYFCSISKKNLPPYPFL